MKKIILSLVSLSIFIMVNAQTFSVPNKFINLTAGFGPTNVVGKDALDHWESKMGFQLGASYISLNPSQRILFEPGIRLIAAGTQGKVPSPVISTVMIDLTTSFTYLEPYLKVKLNTPKNLYPYAGLGVAFLTKAELRQEAVFMGVTQSRTDDISNQFTKVNFPILLGIDFLLDDRIIIGLEYSRTLNTIDEVANRSFSAQKIMFNVGVGFRL